MASKKLIEYSKLVLVESSKDYIYPFMRFTTSDNEDLTVFITPEKTLKDLASEFSEHKFGNIQFYNVDGSIVSSTTSVIDAVSDPLILKLDSYRAYSIFNLKSASEFLTPEQRFLANKFRENSMSLRSAELFGIFNNYFSKELEKINSEEVHNHEIESLGKIATLQLTNQIQSRKHYLIALMNSIKANYSYQLQKKQDLEQAANKHANRVMWSFFGTIALQFAAVQYGTYVVYSWDIMEPITCLMGMGDACIGYFFWINCNKQDYSLEGIHNYFYSKKLSKLYKKNNLSQEETQKIDSIVNDLERKLYT